MKIISIDNIHDLAGFSPHYCRDNADRARWLAFKLGMTNKIRPCK